MRLLTPSGTSTKVTPRVATSRLRDSLQNASQLPHGLQEEVSSGSLVIEDHLCTQGSAGPAFGEVQVSCLAFVWYASLLVNFLEMLDLGTTESMHIKHGILSDALRCTYG
jgi:hypothetical protein